MSSRNAWPLCEIEERSADLVGAVARRLAWLVNVPEEHARFLNTLALLEHIGSRKIMVSQSRGLSSRSILKHLAEETRHAYLFKRWAEDLAGRALSFDPRDTVRPESAKMYFGRLDASIARALGSDVDRETPYLTVSLIVEIRAIWMYRLHQAALFEAHASFSLKSVLAEEDRHLLEMQAGLSRHLADAERIVPELVGIEDRLFRGYWSAMEAAWAIAQRTTS